ncbi:DMT family transporter [Ornithinibacillus xuwenensis]|uniref:Multidrug efflux SMR transporter n=1 Tax=Ornithinibacillus xuwenensis TaxID=3144668 RepID=A0ABU9XJB7_9BACI
MDWIFLVIAGFGELVGVTGINKINQKKTVGNFVFLIGGFMTSFLFLSFAMQTISMGTAYAVWTGIGTVGSVLVGMFFYNEPKSGWRILFIGMVISSAVGLKLIS